MKRRGSEGRREVGGGRLGEGDSGREVEGGRLRREERGIDTATDTDLDIDTDIDVDIDIEKHVDVGYKKLCTYIHIYIYICIYTYIRYPPHHVPTFESLTFSCLVKETSCMVAHHPMQLSFERLSNAVLVRK